MHENTSNKGGDVRAAPCNLLVWVWVFVVVVAAAAAAVVVVVFLFSFFCRCSKVWPVFLPFFVFRVVHVLNIFYSHAPWCLELGPLYLYMLDDSHYSHSHSHSLLTTPS